MQGQSLRLGVNIDHIATVRNARGGDNPDPIRAAHLAAAGAYCESRTDRYEREYARIQLAAERAEELNLECHAGHGLNFDNVGPIASISTLVELNIGHFLIGEAIFIGLERSVRKMRLVMDNARDGCL